MKSRLSSLQHSQTLLRIFVFSFFTVIVWIGFTLFQSQQQTGISPELQQMAVPLNPNIDTQVINRIQQKHFYTDDELSNFPVFRVVVDQGGVEHIVTTPATADNGQVAQTTPAAPTATPSASTGPFSATASGTATGSGVSK